MNKMNLFHINLKNLRLEHKIKQSQLAELLGVSVRQYQRYEKGNQEVSIAALIALADFYQVSIDYLVGRTDQP